LSGTIEEGGHSRASCLFQHGSNPTINKGAIDTKEQQNLLAKKLRKQKERLV